MRRVCFVGASTTEGMGDEAGLGWPGRLWQAHRGKVTEFVPYNLGVRGQTMHQIKKRAREECNARLLQSMGPLIVLGTGANDLSRFADGDYDGKLRTPRGGLARTFRALVGELKELAPILVVGPAPIDEAQMPYRLTKQMQFDFRNEDIDAGSVLYADICRDLDVPFFNLYAALADSPVYRRALAEGDGLHPTGIGYQRCVEILEDWIAWKKAIGEGWVR
ncbi:GDSL-type esterase/lipase family protein [Cohaesibacter celericrescens]|uniref:SGNH hydrolase-type esterase domain-containing protein n=1 Tax=Cohaesibacter celericrescens TaxID=2067669 RepID=A0A2N5XV57_9HYPH|nr:GDSL-type esterase/lipase family protein [Cohaesibacter celericrescens]PLW78406.1 hypothetical protein C0081_04745 [Cohaesibacter celericrescens]